MEQGTVIPEVQWAIAPSPFYDLFLSNFKIVVQQECESESFEMESQVVIYLDCKSN